MERHMGAGASGDPLPSIPTRTWRIVADVRQLGTAAEATGTTAPPSLARLLEDLRHGSIPDDESKRYQGPPIGFSWQTIVHQDGYKDETGDIGGVRGSFGDVKCRVGLCERCVRHSCADYLLGTNPIICQAARHHCKSTHRSNDSSISTYVRNARQTPHSSSNLAAASSWQTSQRSSALCLLPAIHVPPPVVHHLMLPDLCRSSSLVPQHIIPKTVTSQSSVSIGSSMASLNALAPVFDEKAYWKAREARAKAEISASKIPTGPRSKASNSRISSTGTVFGAKSIDHRPATARKNDRMNRARIGYTGKSPASTSGYNPHRLSSPGSTSTATSRGRRDTVTSIEEHTFASLPSPFNSRMV